MAEIGNKFIFTTEGRTSLVAQLGGIRFSVLGAILIQGLKPVEVSEDKEDTTFEDAFKNLTLESLSLDNGVVLGLKNVDYSAIGNQKISPVNLDSYQSAFSNITQNLIPLHYVPAQEVEDTIGNVYGIYELDVDQTLLACNFAGDDSDVSFVHIGLIGKQYTQTDDATYNVDHTQKPILVGIAQLDGKYVEETNIYEGGIQLLADQNQYVNIKLKLRFTLDERDRDIDLDIDVDNQQTKEILDISNKLSLVNNGLKTKAKEGVKVASDKSIIANFNLNKEGALATDKTLMVAETYNADELENEWNGVGLIHLINRENQEDDDENPYTPQVVLSTIEHYENLETEPVVSYNVMMLLQGKGKEISVDYESHYGSIIENAAEAIQSYDLTGMDEHGFKATGVEVPKFVMSMKPEYDNIAVDIFGLENKIVDENNTDKFLFSKNNFSYSPRKDVDYDTIVLGAGDNYLEGNAGNTLINAGWNVLRNNSKYNTLENSWDNIIQCNGQENILLNSNNNIIDIYGFIDEYKNNAWFYNCTLINSDNNIIQNLEDSVLINARYNVINTNNPDDDNSLYNLNIIGGEGNIVDYGADDLYLMCSNTVIHNSYAVPIKNNIRTLILGNNAKWEPREWTSRPGILYGNGNVNGGNAINALEFFPDEGLLKLYDKDRTNTIIIGGDVGIQFPNSVNQSLEMTMKTLDITDKLLLSKGNKSITLSTVDNENIVVSDSDSQYTLKYKSSNSTLTLIGHGYESNISNNYLNYKHDSYTAQVDYNEFSIGSKVNNTTNKISITDTGIVISKDNKPVVTINENTYYQKARVDIFYAALDTAAIPIADITYFKGPADLRTWFENVWKAAPIACAEDGDGNPCPNEAFWPYRSNGSVTRFHVDENGSSNWTQFANLVTTTSNGVTEACKFSSDGDDMFYFRSMLPEVSQYLDEIEINLYIDDMASLNYGLVWILTPYNNSLKGPLVKLNIILSNGLFGNGEGEDFWYWASKNVTTSIPQHNPKSMEAEKVDLDYDRALCLISKPLYVTSKYRTNIGNAGANYGWFRVGGY